MTALNETLNISFLKVAIFRGIRAFISVADVQVGWPRQIYLCLGPFILRNIWPGSDIPKEVRMFVFKKGGDKGISASKAYFRLQSFKMY